MLMLTVVFSSPNVGLYGVKGECQYACIFYYFYTPARLAYINMHVYSADL